MVRYDADDDWDEVEAGFIPKDSNFTLLDGLLLIGAVTAAAIVVWFIIRWLEQNIRMPPPNFALPQTPFWSPYPYSPFIPSFPQPPPAAAQTPVVSTATPACPPCVCGAPPPTPVMIPGPTGVPAGARSAYGYARGRTRNNETWSIKRDKRGNIESVDVDRDVREF